MRSYSSHLKEVDGAVFRCQMELDIAFLAKTLNETQDAKRFTRAADARRRAFEAILWNENRCQWLDYWLPSQKSVQGGKVLSLVKSILAFGLFELTTLISCYSSMYCSTSTCGTAADLTETHMRQILCLCGAACFLQVKSLNHFRRTKENYR